MKNKKVNEQVFEYSLEERNSVISGGNKLFLSLFCVIVAMFLFIFAVIADFINFELSSLYIYYAVVFVCILCPFILIKQKYPLYKENRYHYIKAIKNKMKMMNRSFDNDDMYKLTVSEFRQPMEWYGSLVLGIMFIWMFVYLLSGISYVSGTIYGAFSNMEITSEQMYESFGSGLKMLDIFIGIVSIGCAVLTFFAWNGLRSFKKSAPKLVTAIYAIEFIALIIYVIGWHAMGIDAEISNIPYLVINGAFLIGNIIYFQKRSAWFVH